MSNTNMLCCRRYAEIQDARAVNAITTIHFKKEIFFAHAADLICAIAFIKEYKINKR